MDFNAKKVIGALALALIFLSSLIMYSYPSDSAGMSLEYVLSQRMSIRDWKNIPIDGEVIRSVCLNSFVSVFDLKGMELYMSNSSGIYEFKKESNQFSLKSSEDVRYQLGSDVDQNFISYAPCIITIVWNNEIEPNELFAFRKAGIIAQSLYVLSIRFGLGGVSVGGAIYASDRTARIQGHLGLPPNIKPAMLFPVGYLPEGQDYPSGLLQSTSGNLPTPIEFEVDVLDLYQRSAIWSESSSVSQQQMSNLLWSMYGYSLLGTYHRTVPSSYGEYPFQIFVCNMTGVYNYTATLHSLHRTVYADRRSEVVRNTGGRQYMENAPTLLVVCWNSQVGTHNASDTSSGGRFINVEIGCCLQNLYLSTTLLNMSTTPVVTTSNYESLRTDLSSPPLEDTVYPMYLVALGRKTILGDINGDYKVNIIDINLVAKAFQTGPGNTRWNSNVDLNGDRIINIMDITLAARNFGQEI